MRTTVEHLPIEVVGSNSRILWTRKENNIWEWRKAAFLHLFVYSFIGIVSHFASRNSRWLLWGSTVISAPQQQSTEVAEAELAQVIQWVSMVVGQIESGSPCSYPESLSPWIWKFGDHQSKCLNVYFYDTIFSPWVYHLWVYHQTEKFSTEKIPLGQVNLYLLGSLFSFFHSSIKFIHSFIQFLWLLFSVHNFPVTVLKLQIQRFHSSASLPSCDIFQYNEVYEYQDECIN